MADDPKQSWDQLAAHPELVPLTDAQRQGLQRRLDAYRYNPKAGSPWKEVKARLAESGNFYEC
jgi:putative addiction module component (TIGR02574 family)